ncbi:MAG: HD domain-containing protein [Planctomycetes bacterium]|nr:HD domain-containing protein [Planctomycetota bacterium]
MAERILLVDDAREVLASFARVVGGRHAVVTAENAERALALCRDEGPFAVVVADYEMPGMRGIELVMRIREEWPDTVALMVTGLVDVDVAIDALHNGRVFRFLEKPCPQTHLLSAVDEALTEHRRLRAEREAASSLRFSRAALEHFNGRLNELVNEQTEAMLRLNRFVNDLNGVDSLQQIAELAADAVHDLVGERGVVVELRSRPSGEVECRGRSGPEPRGAQRREPANTADGEIGCFVFDHLDAHGRPLGTLHANLVAAAAASTAVAAYHQIRRRERDDAQHATILALAKLAEQRDNETGKHLERVSLYCTLIAEGLREDGWHRDVIDDAFVHDLYRSAPLHDIGKVGIPDAILLKPGKLTPDEWQVMKTHTDIGAETLRSVMDHDGSQSFLGMSLDIAWCHHEYWNGNGYPRALKGEAIPLAARILALADVYDALTSVRVYKSAWTHAAALDWIKQEAGTHFDPRCVESFVARERRADEIRARLADTRDEVAAQHELRSPRAHAV